jgi:hypothetical protein
MSKFRTKEQALDAMDDALSWRRIDLTFIKTLVESKANSDRQATVLRCAIPLLYAHWEGFIKQAGEIYLNHVAQQGISYSLLNSNFVALSIRGKLHGYPNRSQACVFNQAVDEIILALNSRASVPYKEVIDTKCNLGPDVFVGIMCQLGLPEDLFIDKIHVVKSLLSSRNSIAHGKYVTVSLEDYLQWHEMVVFFLEEIARVIEKSINFDKYKKDVKKLPEVVSTKK